MRSSKILNNGIGTKIWVTAIILGWLSLTIGLYAATAFGQWLETAGMHETAVQLCKGGIICAVSLTAVYCIQTRMLRKTWRDIYTSTRLREGIARFFIGTGLAVGLASVGFLFACWQGWITIAQWHVSPEFIKSILINIIFAFLYEALPEETVLRGFVYGTLKSKLPAVVAFLCQLGMFVLVPITVSYLQMLSGMETGNLINAEYVILLLCFGTTLQLLRNATRSLWASIGFHLAYLEISRFVVLQREQRLFTYQEAIPGTGEFFVLFFMTIIVAAMVLACLLTVRRFRANKQAAFDNRSFEDKI